MKKDTLQQISTRIQQTFEASFGPTPLRQRNEDILREAIELSRFTSIPNLKEEHGDLLSSLLMSCVENGWNPAELVDATLAKIKRRERQYQAYGRKLNVIIIGGGFNPITQGHVALAEFILNSSSMFDIAWILPCLSHMYGKKMVAPEHRLEMCRLATQHDRRIVVSDYEIKNKLGGETYHLAKKLFNEDFAKHQYDFSFAIGADNAASFDKWVNFEDLERMARFVVVPRAGYMAEVAGAWFAKPPHMLLKPEKGLPDISSTQIREALKNYYMEDFTPGRKTDCFVKETTFLENNLNPLVFNYIKKNGLYK